jgi:hypothetical protein
MSVSQRGAPEAVGRSAIGAYLAPFLPDAVSRLAVVECLKITDPVLIFPSRAYIVAVAALMSLAATS